MDIAKLVEALKHEESPGGRPNLKMYLDTVKKWTIGFGHNLSDKPISAHACEMILDDDVQDVINELNIRIPWWQGLDDVRQRVLADMCFNMGWGNGKKGLSSFPNTLRLIQQKKYVEAANAMRNSLWYKQVGPRAVKLCKMMETGLDQ